MKEVKLELLRKEWVLIRQLEELATDRQILWALARRKERMEAEAAGVKAAMAKGVK